MKDRIRQGFRASWARVSPWLALVICLGLIGSPALQAYSSARFSDTMADYWVLETVDADDAGGYNSIALDSSDYPHISYCHPIATYQSALKYAYKDGSGWHIETVEDNGMMGRHSSIEVDQSDYPHISHFDDSKDDLRYAYRTATGWFSETVDSVGGRYTSLALDGSDYPHISHSAGGLRYAYKDSGGWHLEAVDGTTMNYSSIDVDGNGYPHIAYHSESLRQAKYAYKDGGGWNFEIIDGETSWVGEGISLVLAPTMPYTPHVSYYDRASGTIEYAYRATSGWITETVDSVSCLNTSIALDKNGYPHVSYCYYINTITSDLKYAYKDGSGWHVKTVDSGGNQGSDNAIAVDGDDHPHISYIDGTDYDLEYAYVTTPPPPTGRYVDHDGVRQCNGLITCYTTIGAAVAASYPGETVYVFPGTYAESVNLSTMIAPGDISFITVDATGTPSPGTATVDPAASGGPNTGAAFYNATSPFVGDVTINGFNVTSPDDDGINIVVNSEVVISNVTANGAADDGLDITSQTGSITITNSTANNNSGQYGDGFDIAALENATVISSTANGNGDDGFEISSSGNAVAAGCIASNNSSDGFEIDVTGDVTLSNCTANDHTGDSYSDGFDLEVAGDLSMTYVTARGNRDDGVDIYDQTPGDVLIQDSEFRDNDSAGIELEDLPSALSVQVTGNIICGNGDGLDLGPAINVNAVGNWWGCAAGPGNTGCDSVVQGSGTVDFAPWIDTISGSAAPTTPGTPTVVQFQFSGGGGTVFLGQGPGDFYNTPLFTLTTDNGTLTSSTGTGATVTEFVNNANGILAVTLTPAVTGTAEVTLDGPCNLDSSVTVMAWEPTDWIYLPLVARNYAP